MKYISNTDSNTNETLREILAKNIFSKTKFLQITKIESGMTNKNFYCKTNGEYDIVVRIPGDGTAFMIDRIEEKVIIETIANLDINADVLYFDEKTGIQVTKFIEQSCSLYTSNRLTILNEVARTLKRLHNAKITFSKNFLFSEKITQYIDICKGSNIKLADNFKGIIKWALDISQDVGCFEDALLPCHNDPTPENFIFQPQYKKAYLIDWEYAGTNYSHWDLSAFSLEYELSPYEEEFFFNLYYTDMAIDNLALKTLAYKIQQDLLWYTWSIIKINAKQNLNKYALKRYNRAINNIKKISSIL
ncbi:choline kinase family protein [Sphingobacterium sp. GVS05A]|uniref:choline kinase family protein n=1 Tax=Sphingobacterium sp. GVS05A TaxID=2862679 RepID=UPI001CC1430E|nr:choline kinase family protein [Sphingobacterium sp. GVS05A]